MRLLLVVILVVILGGSLGIGHTWSEFSGVEEEMELPATVGRRRSTFARPRALSCSQRSFPA